MTVGSLFPCLTLLKILVLHLIVTWPWKLASPFWCTQLILNLFHLSSFVHRCHKNSCQYLLWLNKLQKKSKRCCSSCPENSQNWSFTSCFSPLATHWFMNTVQTRFSVLQLPQLNCSWLHDSADCSVSSWLNVQDQCWKKKLSFFLFLSRENVWTTLCVFTSQLNSIHELDTEQPSSEWALCV